MYRCTRQVNLDAIDFEQAQRVKDFFAQFDAIKGEHPGLYHSFDTPEVFEKLLFDNLQKLLLEYGKDLKGEQVAPEVVQTLAPKIPNNQEALAIYERLQDRDLEVTRELVERLRKAVDGQ
jgi:hypothetical protein